MQENLRCEAMFAISRNSNPGSEFSKYIRALSLSPMCIKKNYGFQGPEIVEMGIDLSEFYKSVEWDILGVPAARFSNFHKNLLVFIIFPARDQRQRKGQRERQRQNQLIEASSWSLLPDFQHCNLSQNVNQDFTS